MIQFFLAFVFQFGVLPTTYADTVCLTSEERKLAQMVNDYRGKHGLPSLPISSALTRTAQAHAEDLSKNSPAKGKCNLHSWSDRGEWTPCCYTSDHKQAQCMWDKPQQVAQFEGPGFEIASSGAFNAAAILDGFQHSSAHNDVILNQKMWKTVPFGGMGLSIRGRYGLIWFSQSTDTQTPSSCLN